MNHFKLFCRSFILIIIAFLAGCKFTPGLKPGEGYIDVKGGKIWYRIIGEGKQIPILLLHGGPGGRPVT